MDADGTPYGLTRWTPDPEPCAECGERARRRWRRGDELVCPDCVAWRSRNE